MSDRNRGFNGHAMEDDLTKDELVTKFINHQDSDGNTAFHIAAHNLNKNVLKYLSITIDLLILD